MFAESTSFPEHRYGIFFIPHTISDKQKATLRKFQQQLQKENYHITELLNLHRSEDGVLEGGQKQGDAGILDIVIGEKSSEDLEL